MKRKSGCKSVRVLAFPAYKNKKSNPYNYLLYTEVSKRDVVVNEFSFLKAFSLRYDLIHIHWPEFYLGSHYFFKAFFYTLFFLVALGWGRVFGRKIVWTIHNLKPHKVRYEKMNGFFWKFFIPLVHGCISLSKANESIAKNEIPRVRSLHTCVTYHGFYKTYYPNDLSLSQAREELSIPLESEVFLFFGQIKPYKNIENLINLFLMSKLLKGKVLLIAGKFESSEYKEKIESLVNDSNNVKIFDGFVKDEDIQLYFNASNFSILPFKNIFNSGSVLLSASFDKPIIVPYSENFHEHQSLLGGFFLYQEELSEEFIVSSLEKFKGYDDRHCSFFSWEHIADRTVGFYCDVLKV